MRVYCQLPNCSDRINEVAFEKCVVAGVGEVSMSEEIGEEVAQEFCRISGYHRYQIPNPVATDSQTPSADAETSPASQETMKAEVPAENVEETEGAVSEKEDTAAPRRGRGRKTA